MAKLCGSLGLSFVVVLLEFSDEDSWGELVDKPEAFSFEVKMGDVKTRIVTNEEVFYRLASSEDGLKGLPEAEWTFFRLRPA
eukprot:9167341-Pyramimonas_sp.AAC.1